MRGATKDMQTKVTRPVVVNKQKLPRRSNPERNSVQGKINRAAGRAFEDRIDLTFEYYKKRGYALIDKTPEPTRIIRKMEGGQFIGVYSHKGQPDYKGTIKGGRTVIFEAKFTATDRLQASAVTETQWEYLTKASELGAWCYILGGFRTGGVYKIPWYVWKGMKEKYGRKYVTEADLEPFRVNISSTGLLMIFTTKNEF